MLRPGSPWLLRLGISPIGCVCWACTIDRVRWCRLDLASLDSSPYGRSCIRASDNVRRIPLCSSFPLMLRPVSGSGVGPIPAWLWLRLQTYFALPGGGLRGRSASSVMLRSRLPGANYAGPGMPRRLRSTLSGIPRPCLLCRGLREQRSVRGCRAP